MTKWNKITQRPLTKAEKELSPDLDFIWVGQTPEFLETVLVHADGETYVDTWQDFGAYGAGFEDADCEIIYWMALPVPEEQVELELETEELTLTLADEIKALSEVNEQEAVELSQAVRKHLDQHGPVKGLRFEQVNALTMMCEWEYITFSKQLEDVYRQVMKARNCNDDQQRHHP